MMEGNHSFGPLCFFIKNSVSTYFGEGLNSLKEQYLFGHANKLYPLNLYVIHSSIPKNFYLCTWVENNFCFLRSLKSIEKRNAWWIQCTLHIMCPSSKNIHSASCIHFKPLMNVPLQLNSIGGKIGHAFPQLKSRKTRVLLSTWLTWQV